MADNIYQFIKEQETAYGQDIEVMENWDWNMKEHVRASMLFKHSKFLEATNDPKHAQPFNNIIYPMLSLRYRAEDIDLKDVLMYVDEEDNDHLSFLINKYHDEVYAPEHDLDTLFDELKEEKIDFGGTLARKTSDGWVLEPLESIAFCDQTDMRSGPIGFASFWSPDELLGMADKGWGDPNSGATISLEDLITLAEAAKVPDAQNGQQVKTPGKYVKVYRVHGALPTDWLGGKGSTEKSRYVRQIQIVAFYQTKDGKEEGVTLYRNKEYDNPFRVHLDGKKIRNRALAFGGVEQLFGPQIWTNYSEIRMRGLLDAVSKVIPWTDDEGLTDRNTIKDMDNMEFLSVQQGRTVGTMQVNIPNFQFFERWANEWDKMAQNMSGATDALLGKDQPAGTPFRGQALVVQQGMGLHQYRRGRFATFIQQLYTEGIIPDIIKKLQNGASFYATLTQDEMEYVANRLVRSQVTKEDYRRIFDGQAPLTPEEKTAFEAKIRSEFAAKGNKHFFKILAGELEEKRLKVKVNVAGKQQDLLAIVDKLSNIWSQALANPQILQDPYAVKVFNKIIQYSGLDPIDFGYTMKPAPLTPPQTQPQPQQPQQITPPTPQLA